MSTIQIKGSDIGNFKSNEQLQTYKNMKSVMDTIDDMTRDIVTLDDNPDKYNPVYGKDWNFNKKGNVLIDNRDWHGNLEFDTENKAVNEMTMINEKGRIREEYNISETEDKKIYTHTKTDNGEPCIRITENKVTIDKKTMDMELTDSLTFR